MSLKLVSFKLNDQCFAFELKVLEMITQFEPPKMVPSSVPSFLGVLNLRKKVISVFNLHQLLGLQRVGERPVQASIIVVKVGDLFIGYEVDSVEEVIEVDEKSLIESRQVPLNTRQAEFIQALYHFNQTQIILLNFEKLVREHEMSHIKQNISSI